MSKITDVGAAYDPQFERVEMRDKLREVAKAALEWLKDEKLDNHTYIDDIQFDKDRDKIAEELEAALAEPAIKDSLTVAEPVAWMSDSDVGFYKEEFGNYPCVPLYAAPPRREWVGLTGDEIEDLPKDQTWWQIIRAAEEILKDKNT